MNVSSKTTYLRDDALRLARQVEQITVFKGKNITEFDPRQQSPSEDELLDHLLGPTGNMRAPTIMFGKHLVVGFHVDGYSAIFRGCNEG